MGKKIDQDCVDALMEIKSKILELIGESREIVRGVGGVIGERAEAYWISHIEDAIESEFSMGSMEDTIQEIKESLKDKKERLSEDPEFLNDIKSIYEGGK